MARPPLRQGRRVGATIKQTSGNSRKSVKTEETPKSTITANPAGAPISIEQDAPDLTVPTMDVDLINPNAAGTITPQSQVQTVGQAGTVGKQTIDAPTMAPAAQQQAPIQVTAPEDMEGAQFEAATATGVEAQAAQGQVSEEAQAQVEDVTLTERAKAAQRDAQAEQEAMAEAVDFDPSSDAFVDKVTGEVATIEAAKAAEIKAREAITGEPAPDGEAAQIMSMYEADQLQKRTISKNKVIQKLKTQGLKDSEIAQRLADNPELVAEEMENMPESVRSTLSGLPEEALVSAQMETLMAGMEDGEVPTWARPALAKVEANLAKRGMSASSVGRDALFNAIIQSALPIAQSNAQAIQSATAQDKQIAADFLSKNAAFKQQMEMANLSNDQQMRLANLTALNQADSQNLTAAQQTELANLNNRMQTNLLEGKIAADMNQAQLTVDQKAAIQNAMTSANFDMASFNAEQQAALANSKFMQSMTSMSFTAEQQAAMQNATTMANMDMANLDKNMKLAVQNAQAFLQMDMANLSNEQQSNVLTTQNRQQAMLSTQAAENAARQFAASSEQQTEQFMAQLATQIQQYNSSANSAREQFNATEANRRAAIEAGNELQAAQLQAQLAIDVEKFNEQQDFQRDQWNAANAQAVEQSNIQWRRQANTANTAALNAANQQNVQIAYNLTSQQQTQLWQQLRDEANYIRQAYENDQQRRAQMIATAIGNESVFKKKEDTSYFISALDRALS